MNSTPTWCGIIPRSHPFFNNFNDFFAFVFSFQYTETKIRNCYFMLPTLNNSYRSPAINPIKNWLNALVEPNPNLAEDGACDENMRLAVRQFQIQNGSLNPHGSIDNVTLYNILVRTSVGEIDRALSRNTEFGMLVLTLGMVYDDEVHKNLTFGLAVAAGFHFPNATEISGYDVGVDYDPDTQPLPTGAKDVGLGANYQRLKDWHFVTPERLSELNNVWRSSGSLKDLGMYMHTFQDTFSHGCVKCLM